MGKINGCMKAVFIVFNGLFAVLGVALIWHLILAGIQQQVEAWLAALAAFLISLLGNLAARIESKFLLKVFAVLMGIGMEVMLICGVVVIGWIIQMMGLIFSVIMVKQIRPTGSDRIRQRRHTVGAAVEMTTD